MKKLLLLFLLLTPAVGAFAQAAPATEQAVAAPAVGIAKTTQVPLSSKRALILDDGVKRKTKSAFYEDDKGKVMRFDSEGAVLNFLASLGWDAMANGTEQTPNGTFNLYMLKRHEAGK